MIKAMIQARVNMLFKELENIAIEVAEKEVEKQNTTSIMKMTKDSIDEDIQKRVMILTMQLTILSGIGGTNVNTN